MDNFYIITNSDKDENLEFSGQIEEYLHKNGCRCMVQQAECLESTLVRCDSWQRRTNSLCMLHLTNKKKTITRSKRE